MRAKQIIVNFEGFIEGAKGNFGVKKAQKPREFADYMFCQHTKNNITNYWNQRCIGFM